MKKRNELLKYKYLNSILFIAVIFGMFFFNVKDTVSNYFDPETESSVSAAITDLENVESATYPFININGLYQGIMQRNYMYDVNKADELIRVNGKYLVSASSDYNISALKESAAQLKQSSDWLNEMDIPMVYVQAASKMTVSPENSMPGIPNTSYEKVKTFLTFLKQNKIDYLDSRAWIKTLGMSAFFKTDHHWTINTGLTVSSEICNYLDNKENLQLNSAFYSSESFDVKTNRDAFLGAEGRRTGRYYVGLDDFSVILPKYDTDFSVEIHTKEGKTITRTGSFEKSILDISKNPARYSFEDSAYYLYWGGDYSSVHVANSKLSDGKSIVIVKDSYGIPVSAFMAGAFKEMEILDLRYYTENKPINQVIQDTKPDAVVFVYGSGYLEKSSVFNLVNR